MESVPKPDAKPPATDRELLELCRAGDEAAFDDLVVRHEQRAFNIAFQFLHDREDATEVAQDAFVRIYRSIGDFRGDCEFTTWLHQIVVNLARNKHRWWKRRGKQMSVSLDSTIETDEGEIAPQIATKDDGPDVEAAKNEFTKILGRRMDSLPRKLRQVLVLRNVENLSYEEIADVLDCSVGTVKSRIARARETLRKSMKDVM